MKFFFFIILFSVSQSLGDALGRFYMSDMKPLNYFGTDLFDRKRRQSTGDFNKNQARVNADLSNDYYPFFGFWSLIVSKSC